MEITRKRKWMSSDAALISLAVASCAGCCIPIIAPSLMALAAGASMAHFAAVTAYWPIITATGIALATFAALGKNSNADHGAPVGLSNSQDFSLVIRAKDDGTAPRAEIDLIPPSSD